MSIKNRFRIAKSVSQNIPLSQVDGGFLPLAALAPFAVAAGVPLAASAGKFIGRKLFGQGLLRAGDTWGPQTRPMHLNPLIGPTKGFSTPVLGPTPKPVLQGSGLKKKRSRKTKRIVGKADASGARKSSKSCCGL